MYFGVKGIVKVIFIVVLCNLLVHGPQFEKYGRRLPLQAKFRAVCVVSNCGLQEPPSQQSGSTSQCTVVEYFSTLRFCEQKTYFLHSRRLVFRPWQMR